MPSHPDRVNKNYNGICPRCLKNPTSLFTSDTYIAVNRTKFYSDCLYEMKYGSDKTEKASASRKSQ